MSQVTFLFTLEVPSAAFRSGPKALTYSMLGPLKVYRTQPPGTFESVEHL